MADTSPKHPSTDTLLAVMSTQLDTLIKKFEKLEEKLDTKIDIVSFEKLEKAFDDHKRDTADKINSHTIKISTGAGILTALSWAFSHFLK